MLPTVLEQARAHQPTYETFLQTALEAELTGRAERARARRLRAARLPARKTLESFDFRFQPSVPERLIRELAPLGFVETATNLVFLGPPGVGKTHLASALAGAALDTGHSVLFTTLWRSGRSARRQSLSYCLACASAPLCRPTGARD